MAYFDHNATSPLAPAAKEAWLQMNQEAWHNPSSLYRDAAKSKIRLEQARERLAEYLGTSPQRVVFNSGATEGANTVLAFWARWFAPDERVLVNPTEHSSVREAVGLHFSGRHEFLPVDVDGVVVLSELEQRLRTGGVKGVVVMAANNETGVIQPWAEIANVCQRLGVNYLCDAAQWLGKVSCGGLAGCGWVLAADHKYGGTKGKGWLLVPDDLTSAYRPFAGGYQENGYRAGTEDVAGICAGVAALAEAEHRKVVLEPQMGMLRDAFERELTARVPGIRIVGTGGERLWNTSMAIMPRGENHRWVLKLDKRGFQVSTGSACSSRRDASSEVLSALGFTAEEAKRALRFSSGWETSREEWEGLASAIVDVNTELGKLAEGIVV